VNLFGKKETKETKKKSFRVVPRTPGDTTPLEPAVADALRQAGMDPARFTMVPYEEGETDEASRELAEPGNHLQHTFLFSSMNSAFRAIERLVDGGTSARISKQDPGWLLVFDTADDPSVDDATEHERFVAVAAALAAEDRGFSRVVVWKTEKSTTIRRP
jgi:hypothetical protein